MNRCGSRSVLLIITHSPSHFVTPQTLHDQSALRQWGSMNRSAGPNCLIPAPTTNITPTRRRLILGTETACARDQHTGTP